jgi:hypothetical protein
MAQSHSSRAASIMIFEGMVGKPLDLEDRHGKERHQGFEDSLLESLSPDTMFCNLEEMVRVMMGTRP